MNTQAEPIPYRKLSHYQDRVPGHRANTRLHLSTLIRWCTRGVKLTDGSMIRLRAERIGTRWLTNDVWFEEFVSALTLAHTASASSRDTVRTPSERTRASDTAAKELSDMGA